MSRFTIGQTVYNRALSELTVVGFFEERIASDEVETWVVVRGENSLRPFLQGEACLTERLPDVVTVNFLGGYSGEKEYTYFVKDSSGLRAGDLLYSAEHNKIVSVCRVNSGHKNAKKHFKGFKIGESL